MQEYTFEWPNDQICNLRQFPYNSKKQCQTEYSVASATPSDLETPPNYAYTGESELVIDEGLGWRIKFTTSGTFTLLSPSSIEIDVFCVGGGGGARTSGGGGGYTKTEKNIVISSGTPYEITIGSGGAGTASGLSSPKAGGNTTAFGYTANGGQPGHPNGGNGGSGGGGAGYMNKYIGGAGGSDGSNGATGSYQGGAGQGTTTREFGESEGVLYSGGGGGAEDSLSRCGKGGDGGGGDAKPRGGENANFYGGGGGGSYVTSYGGSGYRGIAIIRNAREAST